MGCTPGGPEKPLTTIGYFRFELATNYSSLATCGLGRDDTVSAGTAAWLNGGSFIYNSAIHDALLSAFAVNRWSPFGTAFSAVFRLISTAGGSISFGIRENGGSGSIPRWGERRDWIFYYSPVYPPTLIDPLVFTGYGTTTSIWGALGALPDFAGDYLGSGRIWSYRFVGRLASRGPGSAEVYSLYFSSGDHPQVPFTQIFNTDASVEYARYYERFDMAMYNVVRDMLNT